METKSTADEWMKERAAGQGKFFRKRQRELEMGRGAKVRQRPHATKPKVPRPDEIDFYNEP
jgi:hypothetical protein